MNEEVLNILNFHLARKVKELNTQAMVLFGKIVPNELINTSFNTRMFRNVGYCSIKKGKIYIEISAKAYNTISPELNNTIAHEYAHAFVFIHYPHAKAHGDEWKYVMRNLGYTPNRCLTKEDQEKIKYDHNKFKNKMTKYVYKCNCGKEYNVSSQRHTKLQQKTGYWIYYQCCQKKIDHTKFTGKVVKV